MRIIKAGGSIAFWDDGGLLEIDLDDPESKATFWLDGPEAIALGSLLVEWGKRSLGVK
jgi:hypothetical protein